MAEGNDNPNTLAGLWLKSKQPKPSRPAPEPDLIFREPDSSSGGSQMGLLFSTPLSPEAEPSTPLPPPIVRRRRKPTPPHNPAAPAPSTAKPRRRATPVELHIAPTPAAHETRIPERRIWSVRDLVTGIRQQVEDEYQDIWVQGEISNYRPAPSGHIYFTLKDGDAQLSVVLFRRQAQLLRFNPQDGIAVLARGRVSVYESRGQLQLIAELLEPRGAGALQLAFEQLKARLLAEGLFDARRKRPLPAFPRSIGVVTSTGGAVLHDIVNVIRRRHARLNLLIYPALMQGTECAASVISAIRFFNRSHPNNLPGKVDLILLARGGGSIEDLAGFNDEALARAIAASELPVVSAIGHETDFTIADFIADLRAPTPSAAAELITAAQHRIEERVQALDSRVLRAIRYQLILARQRLTALSVDQLHHRLQTIVGRRAQRLDDLRHRLESTAARRLRAPAASLAALTTRLERHNPTVRLALARPRLERAEQSLSRLALAAISARTASLNHTSARLHALSPLAVLNRGYALVYLTSSETPDGTLLRNAADAAPGATIHARLASGALDAEVTATHPDPNST